MTEAAYQRLSGFLYFRCTTPGCDFNSVQADDFTGSRCCAACWYAHPGNSFLSVRPLIATDPAKVRGFDARDPGQVKWRRFETE